MDSSRPQMADKLATNELRLHVLTFNDEEELHALFADPATHTIGDGPHTNVQQTREWLERRRQSRDELGIAWYSVRFIDGTMIGATGLLFGRTGADPEFGFEIDHRYQGQGHGTAAARAVIDEAHRACFFRIWATVRPWNDRSLRALARVGFTRHHTQPDSKGGLIHLLHERT